MTEEEWLSSADPVAMGAGANLLRRKRATDRVLRLSMAAFWGWQAGRLARELDRDRLRDGVAKLEAWAETGREPAKRAGRNLIFFVYDARLAFQRTLAAPGSWGGKISRPAVRRAVWTLHEVFGNPYTLRRKRKAEPRRGWMLDPAWRTNTAVALARQMYDSRDFSAMPILADALQEAGCDNEDVLAHCRTQGEHVRGCWVVDWVLEKG
jgi:hypothetical protein